MRKQLPGIIQISNGGRLCLDNKEFKEFVWITGPIVNIVNIDTKFVPESLNKEIHDAMDRILAEN